ncbi:hypothetical protein Tco_1483762 [Tanacetum coccineum]
MKFKVGDMVMLKVSPWKGVVQFIKQGKLTRGMSDLSSHAVIRRFTIDETSGFVGRPIAIKEQGIKRLERSRIPLVKVRWNSRWGPEFTWEREDSFQKKYPHLTNQASSSAYKDLSFEDTALLTGGDCNISLIFPRSHVSNLLNDHHFI